MSLVQSQALKAFSRSSKLISRATLNVADTPYVCRKCLQNDIRRTKYYSPSKRYNASVSTTAQVGRKPLSEEHIKYLDAAVRISMLFSQTFSKVLTLLNSYE